MSWQTTINLQRHFFTESEKSLAEYEGLTASTFRYSTGVHGLRLVNQVGQFILLPFQGQQIWQAEFHGRMLTMKSMFNEPRPTTDFLQTCGAFLIHCGATAMGVPGEQNTHPPTVSYPTRPIKPPNCSLARMSGDHLWG